MKAESGSGKGAAKAGHRAAPYDVPFRLPLVPVPECRQMRTRVFMRMTLSLESNWMIRAM